MAVAPPDPASGDPFALFAAWYGEATERELNDPNGMALATATPDGRPSVRMVLLKDWDRDGFVFYTNLGSRKGLELAANPHVSLLFHWKSLRRQVRIEGQVTPVSDAEADAYFESRPRDARIGAWASRQSQTMAGMSELMGRVAKVAARHPVGTVPRPPFWSGFRVCPQAIEFWQDGKFRLHVRRLFERTTDGWSERMLFP